MIAAAGKRSLVRKEAPKSARARNGKTDLQLIAPFKEDISCAITHFGASVQSNYPEHPI
jgi:hypothetical protein